MMSHNKCYSCRLFRHIIFKIGKMESRKRISWEIEETRYFLQLIRERQIMKSLDGKRFRADDIFKYLESPMNEKGYNKTSKEMQTRFRTLRLQYNKIRRQMGKSGSGNCMSSFLYAEEMSQLLDFRPIATGDVIDSTPLQDFSDNNDNNSSNMIYEDESDPRDGALPGCSSTSDTSEPTDPRDGAIPGCSSTSDTSEPTDCLLQNLSSESNTVNNAVVANPSTNNTILIKRRKMSRSSEAVALRYADKLKENYEEVQSKIMVENRHFIQLLMESERQAEKEIINNMLESQKNMLKETTNQLLAGLQNIFALRASSQLSTVSVPTVNSIAQSPFVISPVHHSSPFSLSNFESQPLCSSSPFPKVLLNLKTTERATTASDQQIITVKRYPQAENKELIPVQSSLNVTLQDSQNLKYTRDSQFQDTQNSGQI